MNTQATSSGASPFPFATSLPAQGFVFISGQVGLAEGKLQNSSFEAETRQVMANLGRILHEHQLSFEHLVSVTIYLTDMGQFAALNTIYADYFQGHFPTRTCIAVVALPLGAQVEMSAIAQVATLKGVAKQIGG